MRDSKLRAGSTEQATMQAMKVIENRWIPLSDGCRLAARFWFPEHSDQAEFPAVLEYLPYRKRGGTEVRDDLLYPHLAKNGYVGVRVDIRGNGESCGLMLDEYTEQELQDGCEIIQWLAMQPWCNGNVGLIGHSWGGFSGLQLAFYQPEPLKAVVSSCATDNRFLDDIHTMHGSALTDQLTWSQQMFAYSSRPPDPQIVGDRWQEMWKHRLENIPFLAENWFSHPHYDAFWKHGSVCEDYSKIQAAVLSVGGWNDLYSNATFRLIANLTSPCRGIIGPWEHKYPHLAKIKPDIDFFAEVVRWFDHWLKGVDNGADRLPRLECFIMENVPASEKYSNREGYWTYDESWPPPESALKSYFFGNGALVSEPQPGFQFSVSTPQDTGLMAGNLCAGMRVDDELPGKQNADDDKSVIFDSEVLPHDLTILGEPKVTLRISSDSPVAFIALRLCDVNEEEESARVTHQVFNLCHRDSYEFPKELVVDQIYQITVPMCCVGYTFKKGHRVRLSISNTYWPLVFPSPSKTKLTIHGKNSRFDLPTRQGGYNEIEIASSSGSELSTHEIQRPASNQKSVEHQEGQTIVRIEDDLGRLKNLDSELIHDSRATHVYRIQADNPLSAEVEAKWEIVMKRNDWEVSTQTLSRATLDKEYFYLHDEITAKIGGSVFFNQHRNKKIKRQLT